MEWYSQPQNTPYSPPVPKLFWNLRGRAVNIFDDSQIKSYIEQGFIRCESGVVAGEYNPVYDRGTAPAKSSVVTGEKQKNHTELDLTII